MKWTITWAEGYVPTAKEIEIQTLAAVGAMKTMESEMPPAERAAYANGFDAGYDQAIKDFFEFMKLRFEPRGKQNASEAKAPRS